MLVLPWSGAGDLVDEEGLGLGGDEDGGLAAFAICPLPGTVAVPFQADATCAASIFSIDSPTSRAPRVTRTASRNPCICAAFIVQAGSLGARVNLGEVSDTPEVDWEGSVTAVFEVQADEGPCGQW